MALISITATLCTVFCLRLQDQKHQAQQDRSLFTLFMKMAGRGGGEEGKYMCLSER